MILGPGVPEGTPGRPLLYLYSSGHATYQDEPKRYVAEVRPCEIEPFRTRAPVHLTIDGRHFGKLWKHHVRTAQQHLKRTGVIDYHNGTWMLAGT